MRLLDLIFYLLRCNTKVKVKELAEIFQVSTKTIQRDLDKLSVLGIPIIVHRGKNGGVEIDKNYIIARQMLKYSDYDALILALYIGENISEKVHDAYLIDKFKLLQNCEGCDVIDRYKERLVIDLYDHKIDTRNEILSEINKAIDAKSYLDIELENDKIRLLPISYVLKKEGLCLYCYNEGYLLILIDKILEATIYNKNYDGKIINYMDNKANTKLIV